MILLCFAFSNFNLYLNLEYIPTVSCKSVGKGCPIVICWVVRIYWMVYYKPGRSRWEFSWLNENITQQWLRTSLCWQAHCVWTSWAKQVQDTLGESTQRSLKPLLCNVWILSWKLETDFSWLRIWLSLVWIKFYCKGGHFKIWKFILTMKTNLTRPCKLVFGSGWI